MKVYLNNNNIRSTSQTGRGSNGRKILWTKGPSPSLRRLPILPTNPFLQSLFTVLSLQINPRNSNMYSLTAHPTGILFNQPQGSFNDLFSFLYTAGITQNLRFFFPKPTSSLIFLLSTYTVVSFLNPKPHARPKYARSSGVSATILSKNPNQHTSLVRLPSGVRKIFSYYSVVKLGAVMFKEKKHLKNTRSGFWRNKGKGVLVRGVAMNPIDHPHGGRTNAIRYPRTPWGKTTKF